MHTQNDTETPASVPLLASIVTLELQAYQILVMDGLKGLRLSSKGKRPVCTPTEY